MIYRNIAIIAHVDHGKTTLVDSLLRQSNLFRENEHVDDRVMDSGDLERERGITILAKNTAVMWGDTRINIVDTPGHADFGGEVERALTMVDGVIVVIDSAEGPMPQTRFVLSKALERNLKPIVVVNKIDRRDARPDTVIDLTFDMMVELGASDEQLDFPILHAIAREGKAWREGDEPADNMDALFEVITERVPAANGDDDGPFLFQVANLDYSDYLGRLALGRIIRGTVKAGDDVLATAPGKKPKRGRITKVYSQTGITRNEITGSSSGDIVVVAGLDGVEIGDVISDVEHPEELPGVTIDEPTVAITISPNTSPFAGLEGKYVTSTHIQDRLERELLVNVALKVQPLGNEQYRVLGRGELHLGILIESMRREGYEFSVSRPEVILKEVDGVQHEPFEIVVADVPNSATGAVMESLTSRRAQLTNMDAGEHRTRLEFRMPSRGLFGYRSQFLSLTQGEGLLSSILDGYEPFLGQLSTRKNGSLVAMEAGEAFAYAIWKLEDRGSFFIQPGTKVYVGMIVGANGRPGDMNINVNRNKKHTNVRASGSDENIILTPPRIMSLEESLEYLEDDELLEVTPKSLRLRKKVLDPSFRKR